MKILEAHEKEGLKGALHLAGLGLGLLFLGYNAAAWVVRREAHLRTNTMLYAAYVGFEFTCVTGHLIRRDK
jgi:hypothetical protein